MRLTEEVYLVGGSPSYGFGLSEDMDSHVYAIDGGDELALVDCGMARNGSLERICANLRADGLDPERLTRIFVTHYHVDHAGGLAAWQQRFDVVASIAREAARAVETADVEATGFAAAQRSGVYPDDYELRPARVRDPIADRDVRQVGDVSVEAVATPGHAHGHTAFRVAGRQRTHLFTGDCLFAGGRISLLNTHDSDLAAYRESVLRLASLDVDALLPGHGALCLSDAGRHLATAADAFLALTLPRNYE